jgi:hypothetical protein
MEENPYLSLTPKEIKRLIPGALADVIGEVEQGWSDPYDPTKRAEHVAGLSKSLERKLEKLNTLVRAWMKYEAVRIGP